MSNKPRLQMTGIKPEEDKKGNVIMKIATKFEAAPSCKQCQKNPRQIGSSRCKECSDLHKEQEYNNARLQRKIETTKVE